MNNQILYDKIISVTLYRPPYMHKARHTSQVITGYKETIAPMQEVRQIPHASLGGTNPVTARIEFYEGQVEKVFIGYRTNEQGYETAVYKTVVPSGSTYFIDTIKDMQKGRAPNGTVFKTGDRIRVREDGSIWTAVIREGIEEVSMATYRTTIDSTYVEEPAETLTIKCTDEGLKPDMSLSISLLPGQNCYNAILKIRNLNLENKNIRLWSRMVITAGYRTGSVATYTCPIFTSYIEEPNPDGITVFEGITVGVAEDMFNSRYTEIIFVQEKMKLIDLVKGVAKGIDPGVTVECAIADEIMNQEITISKQTVYAQNGAAILNWLQTTISQFIQNISSDPNKYKGGQVSAFVQLVNNKLQIIALNGPNKRPDAVESIISLDMVSGATFNGTALTVIAPWNPSLQPGNLFYMPPEFINGSKLPNVLAEEDYRNEDNLYRALTIAVTFASVENANRMEVLAIPAQWVGQIPSERTTSMTAEALAQVLNNDITEHQSIQVGETDVKEVAKVNKTKAATGDTKTHTFDDNEKLINQWGTWHTLTVDEAKGNCLSVILEYYFFDDPNGPHLKAGEKGIADESAYYRDKQYFIDEGNTLAASHVQNSGCKANTLWWPLTMVGTYWKQRQDPTGNWDKIDPKNPNLIHAGYSLYIPTWATSWEAQLNKMKQIKDLWKWAYIEYGVLYGPLSVMWRAMYYYLGGTEVLPDLKYDQ